MTGAEPMTASRNKFPIAHELRFAGPIFVGSKVVSSEKFCGIYRAGRRYESSLDAATKKKKKKKNFRMQQSLPPRQQARLTHGGV